MCAPTWHSRWPPLPHRGSKPETGNLANLNVNFTFAILGLSVIVSHFQNAPCRKVLANISSGAAQKAYPGCSLYCATKAGMETFIRTLGIEQRTQATPLIPININPGLMDTGMQEQIRATAAEDFPEVARFIQRAHDGELRSPEEVATGVMRILHDPAPEFGGRYDAVA